MLTLLLACAAPPEPPEDLPEGFAWGDPVVPLGRALTPMEDGRIREWMAAAFLDDDVGVVVGEGGLATVSLPSGEPIAVTGGRRGYRVALDGEVAWVATRTDGLYAVDLSDPTDPVELRRLALGDTWHEDVDADGGRVLVGAQEAGARLYREDGGLLATLPADYAFGVALAGDRALVADGASLALWDLSDEARPALLDRVALPATGRDLSLDGDHVAVAMGGSGVAVVSLAGDALVLEAHITTLPGAPAAVALSGELLWVASWDHVALVQRVEGVWREVAHEPPAQTALGIAARGSRALLADFTWVDVFEARPRLGGPELSLPTSLPLAAGEDRELVVRNHGLGTLELTFDPGRGVEVSEDALRLAPGERASLRLSLSGDEGALAWRSNDPDEPEGVLALAPQLMVGELHPDFERAGFLPPDGEPEPHRLSEQRGRVVFLGYFTTW